MNSVTEKPFAAGEISSVWDAGRRCFHCGETVPDASAWQVVIDGKAQPMCCPGCQAVAQAIVDNGCTSYYNERTAVPGAVDQADLVPAELRLYDMPEATAAFVTDAESGECDALFSIEGLRCAACSWLIERRLARLPGVVSVCMNVANEKLQVRWKEAACKPSDVLKAVREIGYKAWPFDAAQQEKRFEREAKTMFRRVFVAGLCMMQVMMYAVPAYLADDGTLDADMASLMRWASLFLTLPAVFYSALPFFRGAWTSLRSGRPGMDVPVALGIAAAVAGSVVATWRGSGDVYFDSVTMFVFLLLCSRYLELLARRRASASLQALRHAMPAAAQKLLDYPNDRTTKTVAVSQLALGDLVLVRPGEPVPTDGLLIEGDTDLDLALLSGESAPQHKSAGQTVPGGAINLSHPVVMQTTRAAGDSTLSVLVRLVERAGRGKPQLATWADSVASWFVIALLIFAAAVFVGWIWWEPARAWPVAIAVLVVSCPCALSLAMPTALAAATDRLAGRGVVIVQSSVLETVHRATHIVFDKTGTLTMGRPVLQHIERRSAMDDKSVLCFAAALEAGSAHPLAAAVVAAWKASESDTACTASDLRYVPGMGMKGTINGHPYRLGSARFVGELAGMETGGHGGATTIYLGSSNGILARLDFADEVRPGARELVRHLKQLGKQVVLLSGDRHPAVRRVADELDIAHFYGDKLPEQKVQFVKGLQAEGAVVAMIGDGINDAAVMSAADVSFAMGEGAALAQAHADAVLLSGSLASLKEAVLVASATMRVIRQNLAWATLYNVIAIPAAALGWLNPWLSGIGMAASSAVVVINALRLRRVSRKERLSSAYA